MQVFAVSAAVLVAATISLGTAVGESENCKTCLIRAVEPASADSIIPKSLIQPAANIEVASVEPKDLEVSFDASRDICATLTEAAESNGLPPGFLLRLIWQESRFDPSSVSQAGARGIAQFMPETAIEVGLSDPHDPFEALPASGRLLSRLQREFGNLGLAAAAYNAGSGRIRNWLANRQSLPEETRNYVRIITGHAAESWTQENAALMLPVRLPKGAPCNQDGAAAGAASELPLRVGLTTEISDLLRKARVEMAALVRKRKIARTLKGQRAKTVAHARRPSLTVAKTARDSRPIRLASARSGGSVKF